MLYSIITLLSELEELLEYRCIDGGMLADLIHNGIRKIFLMRLMKNGASSL
jgi:hypothetical protein